MLRAGQSGARERRRAGEQQAAAAVPAAAPEAAPEAGSSALSRQAESTSYFGAGERNKVAQ